MSTFLLFYLLSLTYFFTFSSSSNRKVIENPPANSQINQACKSTSFPELCQSMVPPDPPSPLQFIKSAVSVSTENLKTGQSMIKTILDTAQNSLNRTKAATICTSLLTYADHYSKSVVDALTRREIKDARAWMSAVLCYQYDCWSSLKYANDTKLVNETMTFLDTLTHHTSNALSMMVAYDRYGADMASWVPPKTERDGFYENGTGGTELRFNGGLPTGLKADVTVCKDGSGGCSKTVQEAVKKAPENLATGRRFVIHIKEGVYEETVRVPFEKKNVVFLGDGMGKTIITGSLSVALGVQAGMTTFESATVGVTGGGFMASGVTFRNTAGANAHQAVAFRSESDRSMIENCEFIGNQDTVYAHSLRQFYKKCRIQGNVDFIFGNSASVFQDCEILVAPRVLEPEKGEKNPIAANGRTDPAQSTGLVFQNCSINGTEEYMKLYYSKPDVHKNFMGRPWKKFSRSIFINCVMEKLIDPNGWMPWSNEIELETEFCGEFGSSGPGANLSSRVPWSTQIPSQNVQAYSVINFIQGDRWIPKSS